MESRKIQKRKPYFHDQLCRVIVAGNGVPKGAPDQLDVCVKDLFVGFSAADALNAAHCQASGSKPLASTVKVLYEAEDESPATVDPAFCDILKDNPPLEVGK